MLAGGMVIAAPSMVPTAAAAGALYVSAENAQFGNTFGGAQIVEVVVLGHAMDTDVSAGEPTVKVYENILRMAQGTDGNWYGYFGDDAAVTAADSASNNLDFGIDHDPEHAGSFSAAADVFVNATAGVIGNPPALSNWNNTVSTAAFATGGNEAYSIGQIGLIQTGSDLNAGNDNEQEWPLIQTYDLTIETFDVVYEQAGADEVVTLNYNSGDLDDFAEAHAKIVVILVKHTTKNLVANNDNYALAA
jgi:hypothetical protein